MTKVGSRVGVALAGSEGTVDFLGYGVYVGDEIPESAVGSMAGLLKEAGIKNPKLVLDDGKVVWGCEAWWGPEDRIKEILQGKIINLVDIDEVRTQFTGGV